MYRVMAALRTIFLLFIIVYALWSGRPWESTPASITLESWQRLQGATWIAIAWIAFETLLGWIVAAFRRHHAAAPATREPGPPAGPPSPSPSSRP